MIITVCGSAKFNDKIIESAKNLLLDGHIVFMPDALAYNGEELGEEQKIRLDNLQKMKIDLSDAIFVVNVDKYIGPSTFSDIDWAVGHKKEVYFLINPKEEEAEPEAEEEAPAEEAEIVEAEQVAE
jgi:hypothetical protein